MRRLRRRAESLSTRLGWWLMGHALARRIGGPGTESDVARPHLWRLGSLLYHWGSGRFDLYRSDYARDRI